ncbi:MAG: hypothetical protein QOE35_2376 [Actinomycetota bacterium]|jgi:hypothetical protein
MRKFLSAAAVMAAMTLSAVGVAGAGTGGTKMGQQCPKGTKGVHGKCVSALAKGHGKTKHTTTTVAPVETTTTLAG